MRIIQVDDSDKLNFKDLLLLADEDFKMIEKYLYRGEMFALYDDDVKSICVVTRESEDVCELKNIATDEKYHGKGYGSKLISYISSYYKGKYKTMLVGTGEVPWILQFYQKNGFTLSHRVKNFFTDNYEHPIIDSGVRLVDMIYLSKPL